MLAQAYHYTQNRDFFRLYGPSEDCQRLQEMFKLLLKSKVGSSVILDIAKTIKAQKSAPVILKMVKPSPLTLGIADETLKVKINRVDLSELTPRQNQRALLMQTLTLLHELIHIRQFLQGHEKTMKKFSIPHQLYANICEEMEATLGEKAFQIELRKLYPSLTQSMHFQQADAEWHQKHIQSFFENKKNKNQTVFSWVDFFIQELSTKQQIVLQNKSETQLFKNWINRFFKNLNIPFTYRDFPLDQAFWAQKMSNQQLIIRGADKTLLLDKQGRPLLLMTGFDAKSTKRILVFVYADNTNQVKTFVQNARQNHAKAQISLAAGFKEIALPNKNQQTNFL